MTKSKQLLAVFLGLSLLTMLCASLWQRFSNPDLTVSRFSGMKPQAGMSEIGRLMEQAARTPKDRAVLQNLVEELMAEGQWQGAENFAQRALALDPQDNPDPRSLYLLAIIHHNQGHHKEAAELLEKLLTKEENPSARYSLGILYLHFLHDPEAGIAQLEKGLTGSELAPGLEAAMREELEKAKAGQPQKKEVEPENPPGE